MIIAQILLITVMILSVVVIVDTFSITSQLNLA